MADCAYSEAGSQAFEQHAVVQTLRQFESRGELLRLAPEAEVPLDRQYAGHVPTDLQTGRRLECRRRPIGQSGPAIFLVTP